MNVKIIKHYPKGQLGGDYYSVDVEINNEVVQSYGDDYHAKGFERAKGFVDGVSHVLRENMKIKYEDIDDLPEE